MLEARGLGAADELRADRAGERDHVLEVVGRSTRRRECLRPGAPERVHRRGQSGDEHEIRLEAVRGGERGEGAIAEIGQRAGGRVDRDESIRRAESGDEAGGDAVERDHALRRSDTDA
ncbi:MAG: hypothetical protein R3E53_15055 [Myxococcota bacterium]